MKDVREDFKKLLNGVDLECVSGGDKFDSLKQLTPEQIKEVYEKLTDVMEIEHADMRDYVASVGLKSASQDRIDAYLERIELYGFVSDLYQKTFG